MSNSMIQECRAIYERASKRVSAYDAPLEALRSKMRESEHECATLKCQYQSAKMSLAIIELAEKVESEDLPAKQDLRAKMDRLSQQYQQAAAHWYELRAKYGAMLDEIADDCKDMRKMGEWLKQQGVEVQP